MFTGIRPYILTLVMILCLAPTASLGAEQESAPQATAGGTASQVDAWINQNLGDLKSQETPVVEAPVSPVITATLEGYGTATDACVLDWGTGHLTCNASEMLSETGANPVRERAMAVRRATLQARKSLADLLLGLNLDGLRTVADALGPDDVTALRTQVQNSQVEQVEIPAVGGGSQLTITAQADLRGSLAELIMPGTEPFLAGIPETIAVTAGSLAPVERDSTKAAYRLSMAELGGFTGLVLDARGFGTAPALLPLVVDPAGLTAYGPFQVSREGAAANGVALYVNSAESSTARQRVGNTPLVTKVLGISGKNGADLIISYEDAALVRQLFKHDDPRNYCRAVVILEERP
ncbi:MAG: hypothetical protein KKB70_09270 [Proteobacteria bacterium]|nr:hypothetical protein [Pseudomonadota bacterium]MBU1612128.1 hypothetical protein [Pseudomonadota bacterium]